jgi:hypothetical protein
MGDVSYPGHPYAAPPYAPPPYAPPRKRRWLLVAIVVAWAVVLTGLGFWAVRHDPPTVPEQRNIAEALPVLDKAAGAMLAAAQGPGRAVTLGEVRVEQGCRITPVRDGAEATRDVTVYVPADQAGAALDAVAKALPAGYRASVATKGRRVGLHADAGAYVAIDADALADSQVLTLEASTGCRPTAPIGGESAGPQAGDPPAALTAVLRALGGSGEPAVTSVGCPGGGVVATYTVDGVPASGDLGRSLSAVTGGATVVRADPDGWAYRTGADSIVVTAQADALRVSATTACR